MKKIKKEKIGGIYSNAFPLFSQNDLVCRYGLFAQHGSIDAVLKYRMRRFVSPYVCKNCDWKRHLSRADSKKIHFSLCVYITLCKQHLNRHAVAML